MSNNEIGLTLPHVEREDYSMCYSANTSRWCIDHLEFGITWTVTPTQPLCCRLGLELGLCTRPYH